MGGGVDASSAPIYDTIGLGYSGFRRPDPRIQDQINDALGDAERVLNVGAGAGSYEPAGRRVIAVEPSVAMIEQRPLGSAPVLRGVGDALAFADGTFDAAMALLTIHHWPEPGNGLAELRRVTDGSVVVFTFDYDVHVRQWLITDYLPAIAEFDTTTPSPQEIADRLGGGIIEVVPVPQDCVDGFCHAWWRRPAAYLDPAVRAGISGIARLPRDDVDQAMRRLAQDLEDGTWERRHADLLDLDEIDAGYRLVIA